MKRHTILVIAIFSCMYSTSVVADIVKYVDGTGKMHFVDSINKVPKAYREQLKTIDSFPHVSHTDFISSTAPIKRTQSGEVTKTDYVISEAELEKAFANLPKLLSEARAVPYFKNGKSVGMRLFAIRKDSLYEKMGLKNGDIIQSVNKKNLNDPSQTLKLFDELRDKRKVGVVLLRGNQQITFNYTIN